MSIKLHAIKGDFEVPIDKKLLLRLFCTQIVGTFNSDRFCFGFQRLFSNEAEQGPAYPEELFAAALSLQAGDFDLNEI